VQWLHFAGEVDKSKTAYCKFLQDFVYQKLFKSVHFNCVIQELIRWHFLKHDVIVKDIVKRSQTLLPGTLFTVEMQYKFVIIKLSSPSRKH